MRSLLASLVALIVLAFAVPAFASGDIYVPDEDTILHDQAGRGCWTCRTHSRGKKTEVIMAETRQQAMEVAIKYCVGVKNKRGDREECERNLECSFEDSHHGPGPHDMQPFYDFARGRNGYGYCYLFDHDGSIMNGGKPVQDWNCNLSKTYYKTDSRGMCVQWTPYKHVMNEGKAFDPVYCRTGQSPVSP